MVTALLPAAAPLSEQASVGDWPMRILLTLATLAVIALALYGLRLGWVRRGRRQAGRFGQPRTSASSAREDAPPRAEPAEARSPAHSQPPRGRLHATEAVSGKYIGTVTPDDWSNRIVACGGISRCVVGVDETGVRLRREGEPDLFIPVADLTGVGTSPGMLLKVYGRHGVLQLGWRLNGNDVISGIWFVDAADQRAVRSEIEGLMAHVG